MTDPNEHVISRIVDDVLTYHYGENITPDLPKRIAAEIRKNITAFFPKVEYEVRTWADEESINQCKIRVSVSPRSAVDMLSDIGHRERTISAYERGLRDGQRLEDGVSADEIVQELKDDPV